MPLAIVEKRRLGNDERVEALTVIGDVEVGAESGVWFHCLVRGDMAAIRIGARTNIQDGTTIHVDAGMPTHIGNDVTVGHNAVIHACTLKNRAFVVKANKLFRF